MRFFLTPEQYNKIYSEESGILINSEISERINYLQDENKKLSEALEFYANVENSDWGEMAKEALKGI